MRRDRSNNIDGKTVTVVDHRRGGATLRPDATV